MGRPDRKHLHMMTASAWAGRSLCARYSVGCVITSDDLRRVLSIGYNGPARSLAHNRCTGRPGECGCLHAEQNAVAAVDSTIPDKRCFCTVAPCETCAQLLVQSNVTYVYYMSEYRCTEGLQILIESKAQIEQITRKDFRDALKETLSRLT